MEGMLSGDDFISVILLAVAFFVLLTISALVDIVRSKFEGYTKLIWVIIVVFVHVLGPILYFTIGRNQKINDSLQ